jgi:hypothetical protein
VEAGPGPCHRLGARRHLHRQHAQQELHRALGLHDAQGTHHDAAEETLHLQRRQLGVAQVQGRGELREAVADLGGVPVATHQDLLRQDLQGDWGGGGD